MNTNTINQFNNMNVKYLYSQGEQVFDIYKNKKGTIKYLRDDSHEKDARKTNHTHYYYHVDFDDGSFDTYVNCFDLIPWNESTNLNINLIANNQINENNNPSTQQFFPGQKFRCVFNGKAGTIKYLRDDLYEKNARKTNPLHYYYHVDFDDGSFETYMYGKNMIHI